MSGRAPAGISYSVSSMRTSSDIEHDASLPGAVLLGEPETVIGGGLDERFDGTAPSDERRRERRVREAQVFDPLGDEALRVGEENQLLEPLDEQGSVVACLEHDLVPRLLAVAAERDQLGERSGGLDEDLFRS